MKKQQPDAELRRLVDGMLDGGLSRTEAARLEERLEADSTAMDYYLTLAAQEALLADALADSCADLEVISRPSARKYPVLLAAAAAFAILLSLSAYFIRNSSDAKFSAAGSEVKFGATLTGEVGAMWKGQARVIGSRLREGSVIRLSSGLAELTHESGARLLIEGPASYKIQGANAGKLDYGKVVAEVPTRAEGFTIQYLDGKIVDFGTEFAVSAPIGAVSAEVGVFRGEVRVQQGTDTIEDATPLYTGHAIRTASKSPTGLRSIPFDQGQYVRTIPTRELPWFDNGSGEAIEWDVSHLVWSEGDYLGVIKWMDGNEALSVEKMELLLDGKVISTDAHLSSIGDLRSTVKNIYHLKIPSGEWRRGNWKLRAWPRKASGSGNRDGILMFESGASLEVTPGDYSGEWQYMHDGNQYVRVFRPDGTCSLWINGSPSNYFQDAHWKMVDGILRVSFPDADETEDHMLRDGDSLLFINQPYRNARRKQ